MAPSIFFSSYLRASPLIASFLSSTEILISSFWKPDISARSLRFFSSSETFRGKQLLIRGASGGSGPSDSLAHVRHPAAVRDESFAHLPHLAARRADPVQGAQRAVHRHCIHLRPRRFCQARAKPAPSPRPIRRRQRQRGGSNKLSAKSAIGRQPAALSDRSRQFGPRRLHQATARAPRAKYALPRAGPSVLGFGNRPAARVPPSRRGPSLRSARDLICAGLLAYDQARRSRRRRIAAQWPTVVARISAS